MRSDTRSKPAASGMESNVGPVALDNVFMTYYLSVHQPHVTGRGSGGAHGRTIRKRGTQAAFATANQGRSSAGLFHVCFD